MSDTGAISERLAAIMAAPQTPTATAMRQMDDTGERILFVVDDQHRLIGVVTDGDIRRWLLSGGGLDAPVSRVMNTDPVVLADGGDDDAARRMMADHRIECVPVVDSAGVLVSAVFWLDLYGAQPPRRHVDVPVVIMAGGEGARLAPFTKVLPKPLVPVGEKPVVELIMDRFAEHGVTRFYLTVNYKAALVKAYFAEESRPYTITFVDEPEALGTAGSLKLLEGEFDGPFFVTNCDILVDTDLAEVLAAHEASSNRLTLVASARHTVIPYGVCELDDEGALGRMVEKPSYDHLVSTGLYVLEPDVLPTIPAGRVYHMTDLINDRIAADARIGVYPVSDRAWLDMGQWDEYREMLGRMGLS